MELWWLLCRRCYGLEKFSMRVIQCKSFIQHIFHFKSFQWGHTHPHAHAQTHSHTHTDTVRLPCADDYCCAVMTGIPPDMARLAGLHSSVIRSALQVPLWREHMKADSKSVHTGSEMNQ